MSAIFDVVIGLVFIYLLLSLITSAAKELVETWIKQRAFFLKEGVLTLFGENRPVHGPLAKAWRSLVSICLRLLGKPQPLGGFAWKLYDHPLICCLSDNYSPSYIPAENFASALLDLVLPKPNPTDAGGQGAAVNPAGAGNPAAIQAVRNAIDTISVENVRKALLALYDEAEGDMPKFRAKVEAWFNAAMEAVSGAYKRWTQVIIFLIGAAITVALNVDTINIITRLSQDKVARDRVIGDALEFNRTHPPAKNASTKPAQTTNGTTAAAPAKGKPSNATAAISTGTPGSNGSQDRTNIEDALKDQIQRDLTLLQSTGLPIGWADGDLERQLGGRCLMARLAGWLLTAIAISFGAPFWFDVLNKFIVVRSAIKPAANPEPKRS
jgi:hypothetical protein